MGRDDSLIRDGSASSQRAKGMPPDEGETKLSQIWTDRNGQPVAADDIQCAAIGRK